MQAIEQAPRPDVFGGKKPQTRQCRKPTGARSENHNHAENQEREAADNLYVALRGLQRGDEHGS